MVQPPNHPAAPKGFNDVLLKPATTDTLQFLATRVGQLVEAKVVKVTHQLTSEKAALETQLNKKPQAKQPMDLTGRSSSSVKQSSSELNPNRYEVLMNVGGNKMLSVQSPLAPRVGQILQLQVLTSQQIEIIGLRTGSLTGDNPSTAINNAHQLTAPTQALKNAAILASTQATKPNVNSLAILQSALRDNLPRQVAKASLTTSLESITRQQPSFSNALQSSIGQLQKSISSLQQVIQPQGLASALRNSGLFYEAKLANIIQTARSSGLAISNPAISTIAENLGIQTLALKQALAQNTKAGSANTSALSGNNISNNVSSNINNNIDHKQATLQLISALKGSLLANNLSDGKPTNPALQNNATLASLWALVANVSTNTAGHKASSNANDEQLLQLLRLALSVITRTQSQQLFTANTQLFSSNDNVNNQSWSLELPIWVDQKLNLIDIHIDANNDNEQYAASKEKAWNARLTFDLEQHGNMVAFASLRGKTIAAVLWVTESATVDKVNAELILMANNLGRLGLQVEKLQCRLGEPKDIQANGTINLLDTEV